MCYKYLGFLYLYNIFYVYLYTIWTTKATSSPQQSSSENMYVLVNDNEQRDMVC